MTDDQGTGYKRPPKNRQYAPGTSGNPHGRIKGSRNLRTDLTQLMEKTVVVREDGKRRRIRRQPALLLSLYDKALHGDVKAAISLINIVEKLNPSPIESAKQQELSAADLAIIEDFLRRNKPTAE